MKKALNRLKYAAFSLAIFFVLISIYVLVRRSADPAWATQQDKQAADRRRTDSLLAIHTASEIARIDARQDSIIRVKQIAEFKAANIEKQKEEVVEDTETADTSDPYYIMHIAFEGQPGQAELATLINEVLQQHNEEVNDRNAIGLGNALVVMRKESKKGVTEMEILRHMHRVGANKMKLSEQVGLSASLLELE